MLPIPWLRPKIVGLHVALSWLWAYIYGFPVYTYRIKIITNKGFVMILGQRHQNDVGNELSEIHNYYERLVIDYAREVITATEADAGFLPDVVCVALNHLPPRYVRHDVDASFYLSPEERIEMEDRIVKAVKDAIEYVQSSIDRRSGDDDL